MEDLSELVIDCRAESDKGSLSCGEGFRLVSLPDGVGQLLNIPPGRKTWRNCKTKSLRNSN